MDTKKVYIVSEDWSNKESYDCHEGNTVLLDIWDSRESAIDSINRHVEKLCKMVKDRDGDRASTGPDVPKQIDIMRYKDGSVYVEDYYDWSLPCIHNFYVTEEIVNSFNEEVPYLDLH